jgi:FkbM family methyltransferase
MLPGDRELKTEIFSETDMPFPRSLLEQLTHRFVFRRRLPAQFHRVPMYVSSEGGLRYFRRLGNVDPGMLNMALELVTPGAVVWDVGANMGLFSFASAALAGPGGRVLAIEPDTWLVGLLRRSAHLERGKRAPVDVLPVAVSEQVGLARFCVAQRARAASHLAGFETPNTGGIRAELWVMTVTLDWLLERFPPPAVLKVDVEGAEHLVFQGAAKLLNEFRPVIFCEVRHKNAEAISRLLRPAGYTFFDASLDKARRRPLPLPVWDTLAIPESAS